MKTKNRAARHSYPFTRLKYKTKCPAETKFSDREKTLFIRLLVRSFKIAAPRLPFVKRFWETCQKTSLRSSVQHFYLIVKL